MQVKKIINIKKRSYIYLSFHLEYDPKNIKKPDDLLNIFIDSIQFSPQIGYAGFDTKESLKTQLRFLIFGKEWKKRQLKKIQTFSFNKNKISKKIAYTLKKCIRYLPEKSTWIFIFPTFDLFVKNKMEGVGGFTPYKHTILLTIHPKTRGWDKNLPRTLTHEFNHSIRFRYFPLNSDRTLLDAIIAEGLADNFTYRITRKKNPWITALSLTQCQEIFPGIKKLQDSKSQRIYYSLFFNGKKYPLWAGYSLGYQIVKSFLRKHPKMKWEEIIKLPAKEILEKSGWN